MANIVVIGAGLGGMSAAFELRDTLGADHRITVVGQGGRFAFTPSNPWIAVGWRAPEQTSLDAGESLARRGIAFDDSGAARIDAAARQVHTGGGAVLDYDYLVVCTGPKLAFDEVPGLGPEGHTQSVCTLPHAQAAWEAYEAFLREPGPVVVGAAQGASCFGPAYEFAMILDADLRKRRLRDKVPMTFVTSEPYIGHMGLGCSAAFLRSLSWRSSTMPRVNRSRSRRCRSATRWCCRPSAAWTRSRRCPGCAIRAASCWWTGTSAAPPTGASSPPAYASRSRRWKTGFMIESMVTTIVRNIQADLARRPATYEGTWNAVCLADMGDTGAAFVTLPQIPPRNVTWTRIGKWVHVAKVGFEKYFLYKMRHGKSEPVYEKYILGLLGIERLKPGHQARDHSKGEPA